MAVIRKEHGGSVLNISSGGSVQINSGGTVAVQSGGTIDIPSGASINVATGGALRPNTAATTADTAYKVLKMGNNTFWHMAGSGASPVLTSSAGDMLWIANSASTGIWLNISDGTTGSKWTSLRHVIAGSQVGGVR